MAQALCTETSAFNRAGALAAIHPVHPCIGAVVGPQIAAQYPQYRALQE